MMESREERQVRAREEIEKELVELRELLRQRDYELEHQNNDMEEWRKDARAASDENKKLRAALAAAHSLLDIYLNK